MRVTTPAFSVEVRTDPELRWLLHVIQSAQQSRDDARPQPIDPHQQLPQGSEFRIKTRV